MFFNPKYLYRFSFWTSLLILILILVDLGFHQNQHLELQIENYYYYALLVGVVTTTLSYILDRKRIKQNIALIDLAGVSFALFLLGGSFLRRSSARAFDKTFELAFRKIRCRITLSKRAIRSSGRVQKNRFESCSAVFDQLYEHYPFRHASSLASQCNG